MSSFALIPMTKSLDMGHYLLNASNWFIWACHYFICILSKVINIDAFELLEAKKSLIACLWGSIDGQVPASLWGDGIPCFRCICHMSVGLTYCERWHIHSKQDIIFSLWLGGSLQSSYTLLVFVCFSLQLVGRGICSFVRKLGNTLETQESRYMTSGGSRNFV